MSKRNSSDFLSLLAILNAARPSSATEEKQANRTNSPGNKVPLPSETHGGSHRMGLRSLTPASGRCGWYGGRA